MRGRARVPSGAIKVLIAEDDGGARDALAELIAGEANLTVVGRAEDAAQAIRLAALHRPDVALLDVKMPLGGGFRATREIRLCSPLTHILALSFYEDRDTVLEMIRAGAEGYLVKGGSPQEIIEAIRSSAAGNGRLSDQVTPGVVRELAAQLKREERASIWRQTRVQRVRFLINGEGVLMAYQPLFDLADGRMVGVEALARFIGPPHRGPSEWLAEAEEVGLRVELELSILRDTLARVDALPADAFLSVNLSPLSVVSTFLDQAIDHAPAERIVLEITEHAPVRDYDGLNEALARPRARGVRLAIDDAGAGFASLRHVVRLAPEFIKLDGALIGHIDTDPTQRAMASALISFAADTGATIVAEGIETKAQLETLRGLGVAVGQGFFLAPPGPLPVAVPEARLRPAGRIG
jgi:EAL domain-containing protein (putative c-di-GMP-specific phosphodiesterase class I)/CheY-like chemotaxis protein